MAKRQKITLVLLFPWLVVSCYMPSAELPSAQEQEYHVSEHVAFKHAALAMLEHVVFEPPSMIVDATAQLRWGEARLGTPLLLFDINGQPLFFDYPVVTEDGAKLARIRVAANQLVGSTTVSVVRDPVKWGVSEGTERLRALAVERHPGWKIDRIVPVAHDGPRAGVMAVVTAPESGETDRMVLDLDEQVIAPIIDPNRTLSLDAERDDYISWSYLDANAREGRELLLQQWQTDHEWVQMMVELLAASGRNVEQLNAVSLGQFIDMPFLKELFESQQDCEIHVAPVKGYYPANMGYCTCVFR